MMKLQKATVMAGVAAAVALAFAGSVQAALITNGFTFSVATADNQDIGTHFHSSTGGDFGNPAGKGEVGRFLDEEVRALSEYNITGLSPVASAFVTFDVFAQGGLFAGDNDSPFTGRIFVDAYAGNNAENISDYEAAPLGAVGSFLVSPVSTAVGSIFSFDVTALLNSAIAAADPSFGVRLREDRTNADYALSLAWTFDDFRLTTDDQTTVVPVPGTLALVGLALAGFAARKGSTMVRHRGGRPS